MIELKVGHIVKAPSLSSDGTVKSRPGLLISLLYGKYEDIILVGISGRLHQFVPDIDIMLDENEDYFNQTGLEYSGVIRIGFIYSIPAYKVEEILGEAPDFIVQQVKSRLASIFGSQPVADGV